MIKRSYWVYSAGLALAWAVVLIVVAVARPSEDHLVILVFAGFCIGWISTTIARYAYPPARKWMAAPMAPGQDHA